MLCDELTMQIALTCHQWRDALAGAPDWVAYLIYVGPIAFIWLIALLLTVVTPRFRGPA